MPSSRADRPLIDVAAVAERLGVSPRHVYRLVHERRIPFIKWGHLLRFDPDRIDAWLDEARSDEAPLRSSTRRWPAA